MTPPKKFVDEARKICENIWYERRSLNPVEEMTQLLALALQTSHDEGVREEREACAKVAETLWPDNPPSADSYAGFAVAQAIRLLSPKVGNLSEPKTFESEGPDMNEEGDK